MKKLAVIFMYMSALACAQEPTAHVETYKEIAAKLQAGDPNVDYDLFRKSCKQDNACTAQSPEDKTAMMKVLRNGDWQTALRLAEAALKKDRAELLPNMVAYAASNQLGKKENADFYDKVVFGLLRSIRNGKDGKSEANAWNVVSVSEEYATLSAMQLLPLSQSVVHSNGHSFDVFKVRSAQSQEEFQIYFNIDPIWDDYDKIFGEKKSKK